MGRISFTRGRGVSTASRSKSSSGSKRRCVVPSAPAMPQREQISPSLLLCSRSCASGGRRAYRHSRSSRSRRPPRTNWPACRSNPSAGAWHGPTAVGVTSSGGSPHRRTRAPARGPSATRPSTEAAVAAASTGASPDHTSGASPLPASPGEAVGQTAAPEEVAKLLLHKAREAFAVTQRRGLGTESSRNGLGRSRTGLPSSDRSERKRHRRLVFRRRCAIRRIDASRNRGYSSRGDGPCPRVMPPPPARQFS